MKKTASPVMLAAVGPSQTSFPAETEENRHRPSPWRGGRSPRNGFKDPDGKATDEQLQRSSAPSAIFGQTLPPCSSVAKNRAYQTEMDPVDMDQLESGLAGGGSKSDLSHALFA